jgi:membrane-associated phospholipid phosphatase
MHNPTDVICGALIGAGCVAVGYLAVRTGLADAHERRVEMTRAEPRPMPVPEAV